MPNVEFKIRDKNYNIACGEGEETRIAKLAENLNTRVNAISRNFSSASDGLIMAITALMMEDEINAMKNGKNVGNSNIPSQNDEKAIQEKINLAVIEALEPITKYVEMLANKLENR